MRKIAIKGKEWGFDVKPNKTVITGPKGRHSYLNEIIATGPVTPGKVTSFILKEFYGQNRIS